MLPSILSQQIQRGTEGFLQTTYPASNPFFHGMLERFLEGEGGMFKGPYVSMKLPFRPGKMGGDAFSGLKMSFPPYAHQEKAFTRLGTEPASTLIATGTGSGKTECFLYPVLEHCYRHRGEPGIKAVLVYPMNALATDQARRIAKEVHASDELRGHVRAGLFVGGTPAGDATASMSEEGIITDKDAMRKHPPDILLTNYKMLDYLLIRPVDYPLWQDNKEETLKFFVVDELHTFDGAQGTDLACLIRRLKARLNTPEHHLCCVGTSATLGGGEDVPGLRKFASELFGEPFDDDSVVTEDLLSPDEFFQGTSTRRMAMPFGEQLADTNPDVHADETAYVRAQLRIWFRENAEEPMDPELRVKLSGLLMEHELFRKLVRVMKNQVLSLRDVQERLADGLVEFAEYSPQEQEWVLLSLFSMVSLARSRYPDNSLGPFLHIRAQLWVRELRRMLGSVEQKPKLQFADDLPVDAKPKHIPLVHCRECGAMGWTAMQKPSDSHLSCELSSFYRAFFELRSPDVLFIFPGERVERDGQTKLSQHVCGHCLELGRGPVPERCGHCGQEGSCLQVWTWQEYRKVNNRHYIKHDCPYCRAQESLTLLGSRAASLLAVGIGQLFASPFYLEDPKKLLAFSNSVQDASHRAGFFEARTYGFNFRSALQKVIADAGEAVPLNQVSERFREFWRARMEDEEYLATFLAPDLAWMDEAESFLMGTSGVTQDLLDLVDRRIDWEIWSELGFRARIGRTLEKSGVAATVIDPQRLEKAVELLMDRLPNEIGVLRELSSESLKAFLLGFLHLIRVRGGVEHGDLVSYVEEWGNQWILNKCPHLPRFGKHSRAPAFPSESNKGNRFDSLNSQGTSLTWAESWLVRSIGREVPSVGSFASDVYREVMRGLVESGLAMEWMDHSPQIWGICKDALLAEKSSVQLVCDVCGIGASAGTSEVALWEGQPCRRFGCSGSLSISRTDVDYYGRLYRDGRVDRIYTTEHTGLLERAVRENVERQFLEQPLPSSPNLLSCTPTLEMGINIGDLSSLLLCGVPPNTSSYLQRVGRSGRRDGNAFNLVMAEGKPHDLYFYQQPEEMVAGRVEPPGVFLNAPMVLERQFMGFCFDRWVETGVKPEHFPRKMGLVLRNLNNPDDKTRFPYNLLEFIQVERTPLLEQFLEIFGDSLSEEARQHLSVFVEGDDQNEGNLAWKISNRLGLLRKELESLRKRVRGVQKAIKERESGSAQDENTPEELAKLNQEKIGLNQMIRALRDKQTFNFFTDEGLLPNYAFPEAGVTLRSVIWRKRSKVKEGQGNYETRVFEYMRPASLAIRELAPANTFFAEGRKVTINRVSMDLAEEETWRFCPECSHAENVIVAFDTGPCPKCGDPMWADGGQIRKMLRIRQVEANTSDRDSRVDDSTETREPMQYSEQLQVEVQADTIEKAYGLEDEETPFGFEFIRKAGFRQINFGRGDGLGSMMKVAGQEVPVTGFEVCRGCGRVKSGNEMEHAITCRYYGSDQSAPCANSLYLYREFTSEAVRILLPVTSEGVDVKLHSFVAAIYLGLKKRFKGGIDHLQTTVMDEPVPGSAVRKRFLVIYDSVPGGTGYLKELAKDPETMLEVLQVALTVLRECKCQEDAEKDGCYHCLYAFRLSRDMSKISRREAIDLLSSILSQKDQLKERSSVADLSINGLLESELEGRFIEALRRTRHEGQPVKMVKDLVRGKPGWQLTVGDRIWQVEPQPFLGESEGVSVNCKPDFVFHPLRQGNVRPVAIFTDGFRYHADIEHNSLIVDQDLEKRMAILRSGRFRVWSLSWDDVATALSDESPEHLIRWTKSGLSQAQRLFDQFDARHPGLKAIGALGREGPFQGLVAYLASASEDLWRVQSFLHSLAYAKDEYGYVGSSDASRFEHEITKAAPWQQVQFGAATWTKEGAHFLGLDVMKDELSRPLIARWTGVQRDKAKPETLSELDVVVRLFDNPELAQAEPFRSAWNTFLQVMNFIQFLPGARFVSSRGLEMERDYRPEREGGKSPSGGLSAAQTDWEAEGDLLDPSLKPLWARLYKDGVPLPVVGHELTGSKGEVLASAEIAWSDRKVALLTPDQREEGAVSLYESRGWRAWVWEGDEKNLQDIESQIKTALSDEER